MALSRRAVLLAAATAPQIAHAAMPAEIICPLAAAPSVLIPGISSEPSAQLLGGKIYRGLMRWAEGGLQPDLASAVEISPDGLTYTVQLRPGVTWHDSGGFGAADVVFSIGRFHRVLQPQRLAPVKAVAAAGPSTVVITLFAPNPAFLRRLDALSLPIVPQHVHDVAGWALDPRQTTPVGTGPFRVGGWLRLVRFDWFVGPRPALDAIGCPVLPDAAARTALAESTPYVLLAGAAVDPAAIPRLRTVQSLVVEGESAPAALAIAGLRLNPRVKPLDQADVRVGLACAIDRRAVLRDAWDGIGRVATGPIPAGSANRESAALPGYGPREAALRFNAAGVRPDESGVRARLRFLLPPGEPWRALFAVLRRSLGQIAVELTADPVADADWMRRVAAGEYEMTGFVTSQTGDPAADLAPYAAGMPELGPLLAAGEEGERRAQALLVERMPAVWLVEPTIAVVRDARLHLPGGVLASFAEAYLG